MDKQLINACWKCEKCETPLPRKGVVWGFRFRQWKEDSCVTDLSSLDYPYYCDDCTGAIERGCD